MAVLQNQKKTYLFCKFLIVTDIEKEGSNSAKTNTKQGANLRYFGKLIHTVFLVIVWSVFYFTVISFYLLKVWKYVNIFVSQEHVEAIKGGYIIVCITHFMNFSDVSGGIEKRSVALNGLRT